MLGLRGTDDVADDGGAEVLGAVADRSEIGGLVAVATVALAHDQPQRLAVAVDESLGIGDERTLVGDEEALGLELVDHRVEQRVVRALAGDVLVGEHHVEAVVDRVEVAAGRVVEQPPQTQAGLVARLERHDAFAGTIGEDRVGLVVELGPGRLIEAREVADRQGRGRRVLSLVDQVLDQHAERCPPVADVVLADDVVAEPLGDANQRSRR